jgi:hypothetical protein
VPDSFIFAPEIEVATVSLLWKQPERCAAFLRDLDPAVHLTQPHLRHIVEAVTLAYRELGCADWATVAGVLRELKHFEDCGELLGLNEVYCAAEITPNSDQIFTHYVSMLQAYALGRELNQPVFRFNRGEIKLVPNKIKRSESAPDFIGTGKVAGRLYRAAAWTSADGLSISLIPK